MTNIQNLKPTRSKDEARRLGARGGVASGVVRREKRKMRQVLSDLLNNPTADGKDLKEIVAFGLIKKAASGDIKAFETLVKFIGEMPTEREFTETDEEIKVNPWGLK